MGHLATGTYQENLELGSDTQPEIITERAYKLLDARWTDYQELSINFK